MTQIRPATVADIAVLSRTGMRAFSDDPLLRWFFPDDEEWTAQHHAVFGLTMAAWIGRGTMWCTPDGVAMAAWIAPGRPDPLTDPRASNAPTMEHPPWRLERFAAFAATQAEHTPGEPHWYLNFLATHPDWQRRGLGATLMEHVFETASDEGVPCYLETETVGNVAYYRHHGFEVRSEWDVGADGPHIWGMLRP